MPLNRLRQNFSIIYRAFRKYARYIFITFQSNDNYRNIYRVDLLLAAGSSKLISLPDGVIYCPLLGSCEHKFREIGWSSAFIALPFSRIDKERCWVPSYTLNRAYAVRLLAKRLIRPFSGRKNIAQLKEEELHKLWVDILKRGSPRLILSILPEPELCSAAQALGIELFDVQHGVISEDHPRYGSKFQETTAPEHLPSGYLVWDDQSAQTLRSWAEKKNREICVIGQPWYSRFYSPDVNDPLISQYSKDPPIFLSDRPAILISLQWGLNRHHRDVDDDAIILPIFVELIKQTKLDVNWIIRLHPAQLNSLGSSHAFLQLKGIFGHQTNVEWERSSLLPLPIVLKQSNLHISSSSSIAVEASWFGIRSALINQELRPGGKFQEHFKDLKRSGIVTVLPERIEDIEDWIQLEYRNIGEPITRISTIDPFVRRYERT